MSRSYKKHPLLWFDKIKWRHKRAKAERLALTKPDGKDSDPYGFNAWPYKEDGEVVYPPKHFIRK